MYQVQVAPPSAGRTIKDRWTGKDKVIYSETYRNAGGDVSTFQSATNTIMKLMASAAPGTKIKLIVTVPEKVGQEPTKEELLAKIAELTKQVQAA